MRGEPTRGALNQAKDELAELIREKLGFGILGNGQTYQKPYLSHYDSVS